jgi:excisionase family DNA binding protein
MRTTPEWPRRIPELCPCVPPPRRRMPLRGTAAPSSSLGSRLTPYTQLHQTGVCSRCRPPWRWSQSWSCPLGCVRLGPTGTVTWGMKHQAAVPSASLDVVESPPARTPGTVMMLSVNDVCRALQCGRTSVYELLKRGELRAVKIGRLTRISPVVLEEFIAQSECATTEQTPSSGRRVGSDHAGVSVAERAGKPSVDGTAPATDLALRRGMQQESLMLDIGVAPATDRRPEISPRPALFAARASAPSKAEARNSG